MDISLHGVTNVLITFSLVWIVAIFMLMMKQAGGRRQVKKEPIHRRPIFGPPGSAGQRPPAAAFSETFVRIPCLPACLVSRSICTSGYLVHQQARLWVKLSLASDSVNDRCMYCVLDLFVWALKEPINCTFSMMECILNLKGCYSTKSCWDLAARTLWLVWHAKQQWVWTISQKWCGDRTNDNLLAPLTSFATHLTIAQMWQSASYLLAKYRTFTGRYLHFLGPY